MVFLRLCGGIGGGGNDTLQKKCHKGRTKFSPINFMTAEEVFVGRDGKYSSLSPLYAKGREGYFSAEEQGHTKGSVLYALSIKPTCCAEKKGKGCRTSTVNEFPSVWRNRKNFAPTENPSFLFVSTFFSLSSPSAGKLNASPKKCKRRCIVGN